MELNVISLISDFLRPGSRTSVDSLNIESGEVDSGLLEGQLMLHDDEFAHGKYCLVSELLNFISEKYLFPGFFTNI